VLEYLHVPHDVQLPASRQLILARRDVPEASLEESSPDRLGASLDMGEAGEAAVPAAVKPDPITAQVVQAAQITKEPDPPQNTSQNTSQSKPQNTPTTPIASSPNEGLPVVQSENSNAQKLPSGGTVVLDVEEGGIEVPSFLGKNLRVAIEAAQDAGLDIDAVGSGVAREQSPLPGAHVAAGSRITVRFGR
jgi:cell division protein FtsI (penicillin-binding protein 3)